MERAQHETTARATRAAAATDMGLMFMGSTLMTPLYCVLPVVGVGILAATMGATTATVSLAMAVTTLSIIALANAKLSS
jgi:hypothetical protein